MKDIALMNDFNTLSDNEKNLETYICVNFSGYPARYERKLTLGKKYNSDVIRTINGDKFIYIFDDKGDYTNYRLSMFKTVSEERDKKIDKLLYE
jgi:hypothetical protein